MSKSRVTAVRDEPNKLDRLLAEVREVAAAEYERGRRDVLARVVRVAESKDPESAAAISGMFPPPRAPRGAARALVERVLKAGPRTIQEIRQMAKTTVEKTVSYQTARLELERGKKEKRYKNQGGVWSLVE